MCDVGAMVSGLQVEASLEVGIPSLVELTAEFRLQGAGSGESGSSGPSPLTDCTVPAAAARSSPARRAPQPRALPAGPRWDRRLWRLACGQAARRRGPVWSPLECREIRCAWEFECFWQLTQGLTLTVVPLPGSPLPLAPWPCPAPTTLIFECQCKCGERCTFT